MEKLLIGILGVGAIGSVIASHFLANEELSILYYNRSPRSNIRIISGENVLHWNIHCFTKLGEKQELDWLIICIKEHQYHEARDWIRELVSKRTKVVLIRNGIKLKASVDFLKNEFPIIECQIDCSVQREEDGSFRKLSYPKLIVSDSEYGKSFISLFGNSEISVSTSQDFRTDSWKKLCLSASLGGALCIAREKCSALKKNEYQTLFQNLLKEAIAVAKSDGAQLKENYFEQMIDLANSYPDSKGSSMLADYLSGNKVELGAKNGVITQLGKFNSISTPYNDLVIRTILNSKLSH